MNAICERFNRTAQEECIPTCQPRTCTPSMTSYSPVFNAIMATDHTNPELPHPVPTHRTKANRKVQYVVAWYTPLTDLAYLLILPVDSLPAGCDTPYFSGRAKRIRYNNVKL